MINNQPPSPETFPSWIISAAEDILGQNNFLMHKENLAFPYIYPVLFFVLLLLILFFTRTGKWVSFAIQHKWKSRIIVFIFSIGIMFTADQTGGLLAAQLRGQLYPEFPDIISTSIKVGAYGLLYNSQAYTHIPKDQRGLYRCAFLLGKPEAKKMLEGCGDAPECSIKVPPRSRETLFQEIRALQAQAEKPAEYLQPCLSVKLPN